VSTQKTYSHSTRFWFNDNNELHRTDGPAAEWANGDREWWVNGLLHRADGPAIEWEDGDREWYFNGTQFDFDQWLTTVSDCPAHQTFLMLKWS
jgi:hypothetical protein